MRLGWSLVFKFLFCAFLCSKAILGVILTGNDHMDGGTKRTRWLEFLFRFEIIVFTLYLLLRAIVLFVEK